MAEKINQHYQIKTNFTTRCEWLCSYFRNHNQYYLKYSQIINDLTIRELQFTGLTQFVNYDIPQKIDFKNIINNKCKKINVNGNEYYTLEYLNDIENDSTKILLSDYCNLEKNNEIEVIAKENSYYDNDKLNTCIHNYEINNNLKLVRDQVIAIHNCVKNKFSVICGPPELENQP